MAEFLIYKSKYQDKMSEMVVGDIYELTEKFIGIERELLYSVRSNNKSESHYIVHATEFISIDENRIQTIKNIINE